MCLTELLLAAQEAWDRTLTEANMPPLQLQEEVDLRQQLPREAWLAAGLGEPPPQKAQHAVVDADALRKRAQQASTAALPLN